jgi:hypothetical protein
MMRRDLRLPRDASVPIGTADNSPALLAGKAAEIVARPVGTPEISPTISA